MCGTIATTASGNALVELAGLLGVDRRDAAKLADEHRSLVAIDKGCPTRTLA